MNDVANPAFGADASTYTSVDTKPAFTRYDAGWVVLCIGMAIGSGVVFLPIQMGVKGALVSSISLAISYPVIYMLSKLFIQSLSASETCDNYAQIITQYLGKNWGVALGIIYFLMLLKGMLAYAGTITQDAASYLQTFGVTSQSLGSSVWFIAAIIGFMILIASSGERLLFKVSGPLIFIKLGIVVFLGIAMVPYWNFKNLEIVAPEPFALFRDVLLTLPFSLFSILFVQILSPMNIAFRKVEKDPKVATFRALRASRYAYTILTVSVLFFCFSFLLSTNHDDALYAQSHNISGLALAAKVIPGTSVQVLSTLLDVAAIFSAFFGVYLGFQDAVRGILVNFVERFTTPGESFKKVLPWVIAFTSLTILVNWVLLGYSTMSLVQITIPVYGLVSCLIPGYLVYKVPRLHHLRSSAAVIVIIYGLLLMLVPIFKLMEG